MGERERETLPSQFIKPLVVVVGDEREYIGGGGGLGCLVFKKPRKLLEDFEHNRLKYTIYILRV